MKRNEDYVNGIKFLLRECKKSNINIRSYAWVCDLSMILSHYNVCYKFWFNTCNQNRLNRIPQCDIVYDIVYNSNTSLFTWDKTPEGGNFWHLLLIRDLFKHLLDTKLNNLLYIYGNR